MIEINDIPDMKLVIEKYKLDFFLYINMWMC